MLVTIVAPAQHGEWLMWQTATRDGLYTTELTPASCLKRGGLFLTLVAPRSDNPFWLRVIFPGPLLEPIQALWRNCARDIWTGGKAEPEEFAIVRSCHRALRLADLKSAA